MRRGIEAKSEKVAKIFTKIAAIHVRTDIVTEGYVRITPRSHSCKSR